MSLDLLEYEYSQKQTLILAAIHAY